MWFLPALLVCMGIVRMAYFLPTSPSQALARQLSQRESRERSGKGLASPFGRGVTAGDGEGEPADWFSPASSPRPACAEP